MSHARAVVAPVLFASLLAGCEPPGSWGDWNAIIVATSDEQWAEVGEMV